MELHSQKKFSSNLIVAKSVLNDLPNTLLTIAIIRKLSHHIIALIIKGEDNAQKRYSEMLNARE